MIAFCDAPSQFQGVVTIYELLFVVWFLYNGLIMKKAVIMVFLQYCLFIL